MNTSKIHKRRKLEQHRPSCIINMTLIPEKEEEDNEDDDEEEEEDSLVTPQ